MNTWSQSDIDCSYPGDSMLAFTGRHAKAASTLQDLDSPSSEYAVSNGSCRTSDHLLGGATNQCDGGLSTSSSCDSGLGPDWDLPAQQDDDDDLSWVRDEAALQAYYNQIYQEELNKLLFEWQLEKNARAASSPSQRSLSSSTPVVSFELRIEPPELPIEPPELPMEPLESPSEQLKSPSEQLENLSEWLGLCGSRVRPQPAPPWSVQLLAAQDVQLVPDGSLSSAIWRGPL
jgi:hypothetical protein